MLPTVLCGGLVGSLGDREPHDTRIVARVTGRPDHVGSLGYLLGVMRGYQQECAHALEGRGQALRLEEIANNGLYAPVSHRPSLRLVVDERAGRGPWYPSCRVPRFRRCPSPQ